MNKKLRKRKIKALMKISYPMDILQTPVMPDSNMSLIERHVWEKEAFPESKEPIPICDWNDSIILDIVGVVPVAGDALDVGRSFVYIGCGKYLDALIGLICAAPVAGMAANIARVFFKGRKFSSAKEIFFEFVNYLKESNLISDTKEIIGLLKDGVFKSFKLLKKFVKDLKDSAIIYKEEIIYLEEKLKLFDKQYIEDMDQYMNLESFKRWKKKSMESSSYKKPKINVSKYSNEILNFSSILKEIFNDLSFFLKLISSGPANIFKKIKGVLDDAILFGIKERKSEYLSKVDNFENTSDLYKFIQEINIPEEIYSSQTTFPRFRESMSIDECKRVSKRFIDRSFNDYHASMTEKIMGISKEAARNISKRYDIFYIHITRGPYVSLIKQYLEKFGNKNLSDKEVRILIDDFFATSKPTKINVVNPEAMPGARGLAHTGAGFIEILKSRLEETTVTHELMHMFDADFAKFIGKKYKLKNRPYYISDIMNYSTAKSNIEVDAEVFNILKEKYKYKNKTESINFYTQNKYKDLDEYVETQIEYYLNPTEIMSHFNDVRSIMITKFENIYDSYPDTKEVVDFILGRGYWQEPAYFSTRNKSRRYGLTDEKYNDLILRREYLSSKENLKQVYLSIQEVFSGPEAYSICQIENVTGDFITDLLYSFGI